MDKYERRREFQKERERQKAERQYQELGMKRIERPLTDKANHPKLGKQPLQIRSTSEVATRPEWKTENNERYRVGGDIYREAPNKKEIEENKKRYRPYRDSGIYGQSQSEWAQPETAKPLFDEKSEQRIRAGAQKVRFRQQQQAQKEAESKLREREHSEKQYREAQRKDAERYQSASREQRDKIIDRMKSRERDYTRTTGRAPPEGKPTSEIVKGIARRGVISATRYEVPEPPKVSHTVSTVGARVQQDVARLMGDKRSHTQVVFGSTPKAYSKQVKRSQKTVAAYQQRMSDPAFFMNVGGSVNVPSKAPAPQQSSDILGNYSKRLFGF